MFTVDWLPQSWNWMLSSTVAICAVYFVLKRWGSRLQQIILFIHWGRLSQIYHPRMRDLKKVHFASMADHQSADPQLRKKGILRILEIGAGPGANFEFYPPKSQLTVVEPNTYFKPMFFGNQSRYPEVEMKRFVVGEAENMKEIEDNSIDIVVSTFVFCSVDSIEKSLSEISRVLAPGGKFYFWEHVHDHVYSWTYFIQTIFTYTFHWALFHCHLNRKTAYILEKYRGFSKLQLDRFYSPMGGVWFIIQPHIKGIAVK